VVRPSPPENGMDGCRGNYGLGTDEPPPKGRARYFRVNLSWKDLAGDVLEGW